MSDHEDTTPPAPSFPRWTLSFLGVLGSIVIILGVLAIAYYSSRPTQAVDANVVADRKQNLSDVQAKQADLYNNYSWVDQTKKVVRIPVDVAIGLEAAKLEAATRDQPEAPARLSLAASPAGYTPPAPPAPPVVVPEAAPAASATTPGR